MTYTEADLEKLKYLIAILSVITVLLVVYSTYIRNRKIRKLVKDFPIIGDNDSRWLLFMGIVILSPFIFLVSYEKGIQQSKRNNFCHSCHVMHGYINDMEDPDSEHLAAEHYQYRWISDYQCYTCHSEYGLFGTAKAKISGIGHIWAQYFVGYETPLKIKGTYNNNICLHCHGEVLDWQDTKEHEDNLVDIKDNKMSCLGADCHVSPHPKNAWETDDE